MVEKYRQGVDMGAVIEMLESGGVAPARLTDLSRRQGAFMTQNAVGSDATRAGRIEAFIADAERDKLMLIFQVTSRA